MCVMCLERARQSKRVREERSRSTRPQKEAPGVESGAADAKSGAGQQASGVRPDQARFDPDSDWFAGADRSCLRNATRVNYAVCISLFLSPRAITVEHSAS